MEALVYEDSPLADYLEGEGQGDQDWAPQELDREPQPPTHSSSNNFAPRGAPRLQDRIRNKLPAPLRLEGSGKRETIARVKEACSGAISARIGKSDNERFLEQFGYIIVASQLLNEQTPPSHTAVTAALLANNAQEDAPSGSRTTSIGLRGAIYTALASFSLVALLHWARSWPRFSWDARRIFVLVFLFAAVAVSFYIFAKRQWLRDLRHQAVDAASVLIGNAQSLDAATSASVVLIQEVELVSRGYRISTPMPPVSRLEEQTQTRRCSKLRRILSECLVEMLELYLDAKTKLRPLVDDANLVKYYDIYDFSPEELQEAESTLTDFIMDDKTSLRTLRILFTRLYAVRKSTLCCLLALPADGGDKDIMRWSLAIEEMQRVATTTGTCLQRLTDILNEQDRDTISPSPRTTLSPGKDRHRAQLRRLNSLSQGIRGLHAKMHLIREESDACLERSNEDVDLSSTLLSQYESVGADLRGLLQEWEAGKSTLLANLEKSDRVSRPPSILRSPASPTFSIGGSTAVEGSPAAALRALNGDNGDTLSPDRNLDDDEVFEAIALPRKRNSMTREERMARMKEDRAKHATAREKADANTNMLKELETVIKLRPHSKAVLEARLEQANLLKKVVDAIKDLVQDCNFDCNDSGIALQAMDNSHVALVSMILRAEGFSPYRCDRNIALGINLVSLTKVLRAAQQDDVLTLKAEDSPDVVNLVFENTEADRISEYDIKLMDIDQEHLAIPDTEYHATIEMSSAEFRRICTDLSNLSESIVIEASKDGVKFSCQGEIGNGSVTVRQRTSLDNKDEGVSIHLSEPVALTFSVKYLLNFCKAQGLSNKVKLCLSQEVPLLVEYSLDGSGHLRFFLAPKIGDEE